MRHHPDGAAAFGASFRRLLEQPVVFEAFARFRYVLRSISSEGPSDVATMLSPGDLGERTRLKRDACEQILIFLDAAGIP